MKEIIKEDVQVLETKKTAWGSFGEVVYRTEIALQNEVIGIVNTMKIPTVVADIPVAETELKMLKQKLKALTENRKTVTVRFDELSERLMVPEKDLNKLISDFSEALLTVKKIEAETKRKQQQAEAEIRNLKLHFERSANLTFSDLKIKVQNKCSEMYKYAIETEAITAEVLDTYIAKCIGRFNVDFFAYKIPVVPFQLTEIKQEEVQAISDKSYAIVDCVQMRTDAIVDFKNMFADFVTAKANKEQALKLQAEETASKLAETQKNLQQQNVASEIRTMSQEHTPLTIATKALKEEYIIDMEETLENSMLIITAFLANKERCLPKTTVKKWFNFSASNAATALEKVKSEDNSFQPAGINFITNQKL